MLFYYARGLGAARSGDLTQAEAQRDRIAEFVSTLRDQGDIYWAYMTEGLYAELLLREERAEEAVAAFKTGMERTPNRRYALAGIKQAGNPR